MLLGDMLGGKPSSYGGIGVSWCPSPYFGVTSLLAAGVALHGRLLCAITYKE